VYIVTYLSRIFFFILSGSVLYTCKVSGLWCKEEEEDEEEEGKDICY